MARIPLRDLAGNVVAVALVDAGDFHRINRHRWSLMDDVARRGVKIGHRHHSILMHREVMGATLGDGLAIEHINGNKLDNRRANLRVRPVVTAVPAARHASLDDGPWEPDGTLRGPTPHMRAGRAP